MNKGFTNAMKAVKEQAFYDGTIYGCHLDSMITIIAIHNVLGDSITNDQYKEIEAEMQRIMDEHCEYEDINFREAKEYIEGMANRVRVMHDMPFVRDWFEQRRG